MASDSDPKPDRSETQLDALPLVDLASDETVQRRWNRFMQVLDRCLDLSFDEKYVMKGVDLLDDPDLVTSCINQMMKIVHSNIKSEVIDIATYWKLPSKLRAMDRFENQRPMQSNGRRVLAPLRQSTIDDMASTAAILVKQDINRRLTQELQTLQERSRQLAQQLANCYSNGLALSDSLQKGAQG